MFIAICISTTFIHVCPCHAGDILRHYKVFFSLAIICEPAAPVGVINVQCASLVSSENIFAFIKAQLNSMLHKYTIL